MPKKVHKNTGMNPVARAVARERLRKALLDQKIQLYLLQENAPCAAICFMIAQLLSALIEAAALDKNVGTQTAEVNVMRGAVSACEQMIATDRFARINLVALEQGLDAAYNLNTRLDPKAFNRAWHAKPRLMP